MRILVVCGAGASSTFVAMRLRHAAHDAGFDVHAVAGAVSSLPVDLDSTDILLVAPHLAEELPELRQLARDRGVQVVLLPDDVFTDRDGARTLRTILPALTTPATGPDGPVGSDLPL